MSNFICPTCGFTNIDCGKEGYKTAREIKLDKQLKIAIEALNMYADSSRWSDCENNGAEQFVLDKGGFEDYGYEIAQKALTKIKEVD